MHNNNKNVLVFKREMNSHKRINLPTRLKTAKVSCFLGQTSKFCLVRPHKRQSYTFLEIPYGLNGYKGHENTIVKSGGTRLTAPTRHKNYNCKKDR